MMSGLQQGAMHVAWLCACSPEITPVSCHCSQALNWLLITPGASRTVLDARVPYSQSALAGVLGAAPTTYASPETVWLQASTCESCSKPPHAHQQARSST